MSSACCATAKCCFSLRSSLRSGGNVLHLQGPTSATVPYTKQKDLFPCAQRKVYVVASWLGNLGEADHNLYLIQ